MSHQHQQRHGPTGRKHRYQQQYGGPQRTNFGRYRPAPLHPYYRPMSRNYQQPPFPPHSFGSRMNYGQASFQRFNYSQDDSAMIGYQQQQRYPLPPPPCNTPLHILVQKPPPSFHSLSPSISPSPSSASINSDIDSHPGYFTSDYSPSHSSSSTVTDNDSDPGYFTADYVPPTKTTSSVSPSHSSTSTDTDNDNHPGYFTTTYVPPTPMTFTDLTNDNVSSKPVLPIQDTTSTCHMPAMPMLPFKRLYSTKNRNNNRSKSKSQTK